MEELNWLSQALQALWALGEVRFLVSHVVINFVVAVAASVRTNEFRLHKLPEFLFRKLFPYVAVYATVKVFGDYAGIAWIAPATWALVEAALSADLLENLTALGVPIPENIARLVSKKG